MTSMCRPVVVEMCAMDKTSLWLIYTTLEEDLGTLFCVQGTGLMEASLLPAAEPV